jgi:iduronate 2-sulfatase
MEDLNRRKFLKTVAVGAAAVSIPTILTRKAIAGARKTKKPLNILFVAFDDLRPQLGCYGDFVVKSPNIDRIAARGIVFENAYCQQSICAPSRASLMTGRKVDNIKMWNCSGIHFRDALPDVITLPQWFKQNGYFTQNIGKIYHNWGWHIHGDPDSWSVPAMMHWDGHDWDYPHLPAGQSIPPNLSKDASCDCRDVPDEAYFDGRIAELSIKALRERAKQKQPFFLAVGFWKPHSPFNAPKRYWDLYQPEDIPLPIPSVAAPPKDAPAYALHPSHEGRGVPKNYASLFMSANPASQEPPIPCEIQPAIQEPRILSGNTDSELRHNYQMEIGTYSNPGFKYRALSEENEREMRHGYYAAISYADAQLGKVLDELDRLDLTDNTVIVIWGDNGYHLGEETLWGKMTNFELGARVPMIIAASGIIPAGRTTEALAELLDLYPTLVELCGLPKAPGLEGVSQMPVLMNPNTKIRSFAGTQHPRPHIGGVDGPPDWIKVMGYSIRTERWRYTEWRDWKTAEVRARELYDHANDPFETINIAGRPDAATRIQLLAQQMETVYPRKKW